jgi:predicted kinase
MDTLSLILVLGAAGSGKTTFAQHLVPKLGCVYLNTDSIADIFFPGDRDSPAYRAANPSIYRALYDIAFANLRMGNSVLIDAPHVLQMRDPEWWTWISEECSRFGARLRIIRCFSNAETLRSRLEARGEARDANKLGNWSEHIGDEHTRPAIPLSHIEINTREDVDRNLAVTMEYLLGP